MRRRAKTINADRLQKIIRSLEERYWERVGDLKAQVVDDAMDAFRPFTVQYKGHDTTVVDVTISAEGDIAVKLDGFPQWIDWADLHDWAPQD